MALLVPDAEGSGAQLQQFHRFAWLSLHSKPAFGAALEQTLPNERGFLAGLKLQQPPGSLALTDPRRAGVFGWFAVTPAPPVRFAHRLPDGAGSFSW